MMDRQPIKVREQSGVDMRHDPVDYVTGKLRLLGDRIAVKPAPVKFSSVIVAEREGNFRGTVVAVGPGEFPNIYNKDRSKVRKSVVFRKTEVKVGDFVELGGLDIGGYAFKRINLNGEEVIICSEKDVAILVSGDGDQH